MGLKVLNVFIASFLSVIIKNVTKNCSLMLNIMGLIPFCDNFTKPSFFQSFHLSLSFNMIV